MRAFYWKELFKRSSAQDRMIRVRVFMRGGHPLLMVPCDLGVPNAFALDLYAPQTRLAGLARQLWRCSLGIGICPGARIEELAIDEASPFVQFLSNSSRTDASASRSAGLPPFTLLAGNPHGVAPRFILQVFDSSKRPKAVVKAGIGKAAGELINREAALLEGLQGKIRQEKRPYQGIPGILGRFSDGEAQAFAMPFVHGESPKPAQCPGIQPLLTSWLDRTRKVQLSDLAPWQRLEASSSQDPLFAEVNHRLSKVQLTPALFHGDFTPWNVKVSPRDGAWTVLDWERGELEGPPVWDWLHYTVQTASLAEKLKGADLCERMEQIIAGNLLKNYMNAACEGTNPRDWLISYLLHCRDVLRPREGAPELEAALAHISGSAKRASLR